MGLDYKAPEESHTSDAISTDKGGVDESDNEVVDLTPNGSWPEHMIHPFSCFDYEERKEAWIICDVERRLDETEVSDEEVRRGVSPHDLTKELL